MPETNEVEEWRPVVGHEAYYEVSSLGRVRSKARQVQAGCVTFMAGEKILATTTGGRADNYLRVNLRAGKRRHAYVHHLVAEAFLGPRPPGALILHYNDNTLDNRASHLRYGDREENEMDRHVAAVAEILPDAPF